MVGTHKQKKLRKMLLYLEYTTFCLKRELGLLEMEKMPSPIMQYFAYEHLPEKLQPVSKGCAELARDLEALLPECPEKSAGLRKLLEAKDCFVRAALPKPNGD